MAPPSKYVVAVDDDDVSAAAFGWAVANLFKSGDSLTILTAKFNDAALPSADITSGELAMPVVAASAAEDKEIAVKAEGLVDKYMRLAEQANLSAQGKVVEGNAGSHIVAEAELGAVDAVVLGSHGRGLIGRALLGSISDYVRHHSSLPVVVVRSPKPAVEGHQRTVVVAVDESPEAAHAFTWALQQMVRETDRVILLHVQNPIAVPTSAGTDQLGIEDVYVPPDTTGKATVEALAESEKLVEAFMKEAATTTKATVEGRVVSGATAEKIRAELATLNADVGVVGSRTHDVLQRTFLGSVSDFLAHNSPCPCVFVKLPRAPTPKDAASGHAHAV